MRMTSHGQLVAISADRYRSESMPCSASKQHMCACAAAASQTSMILKTGVLTSVSLFVLVALLAPHLTLVFIIVVLISLLLTCLTGLEVLECLVRQMRKLTTRNARGE
jgi:hypothetical protein